MPALCVSPYANSSIGQNRLSTTTSSNSDPLKLSHRPLGVQTSIVVPCITIRLRNFLTSRTDTSWVLLFALILPRSLNRDKARRLRFVICAPTLVLPPTSSELALLRVYDVNVSPFLHPFFRGLAAPPYGASLDFKVRALLPTSPSADRAQAHLPTM